MKYISLIVFILVLAGVNAQKDVGYIISKHYARTHSINLINEIKQFEAELIFEQNNTEIPVKMKGKMPDMFRTVMQIRDMSLVKISKAGKTIKYNPFTDSTTVTKSSQSPLLKFIKGWSAIIDTVNSDKIEFVGMDKIEDIEVYQLKVNTGKLSKTYFVDKLSFLVLRIDENSGKITLFKDYRQLGKYVVPYKVTIYDEDKSSLNMRFKNINLNTDIADSEFEFNK